jgi:hypothetical protein
VEWKLAAYGTAPANDGRPDGFDEKKFGRGVRLVWSQGACAIVGPIAYWKRCAVMVVGGAVTVVDADRPDIVEIPVDHVTGARTIGTSSGELWIELPAGILTIPLADLERLARDAPAETSITVATWYPHRNASARVPAKVVWVTSGDALVNLQEPRVRQIRIPAEAFGLEKGMQIAFADQLGPGAYTSLDVPGRARQTVQAPQSPHTFTASSVRKQPRDPAAGAWESIPRSGASIALVAQLAASPDDDSARGILLDALADAGEPCAATFALIRAGKRVSTEARDAALGPLVHYLTDIKLRGGLPASAKLVNQPPDDEAASAAFLADLRLAMLDTIRLGHGPEALYRAIVGSPNLVGLRQADGTTHAVLKTLRDRRAGQLTHLYRVPYTNKLGMSFLSAPAFSSLRHLELVVRGTNVARRVGSLLDELGAIAGGELHITFDAYPRDAEIIARIVVPAFLELGLAGFAIGGVTLHRVAGNVEVHAADSAALGIAELARATFKR